MKQQKNMLQTKEQGKNLKTQINEDKIDNLPEKELKIMTVKMFKNLGNRMKKIQETFNKDPEELKSKETVMNTITEINNTLEGINSKITEAEEWISDLQDTIVERTAKEQNEERIMKRIEDSLRDLWDNIKHTNIRITTVPEEEQKKKGSEKIFEEIIVENFPNMGTEIVNQVQEAQSPIQDKPKEKHGETHIIQTIKN